MPQHDYDLANAAGAAFRADLNNSLLAIVAQNSGDTEPATMYAYQFWADATLGQLKQRNAANSAWITICHIATWGLASVQAQSSTAFTTAGSTTAFTLAPAPAILALATSQRFRVNFNNASGATPTLAVSGLTAKLLKYRDSAGSKQAITSLQVPAGWIADVEYDGTDYVVDQVATDPNYAKLNATETFTAPQRGTVTTDNDLSFDLSVTNFFLCTPSGGGALTFTNIPAGQGGTIRLVNGAAHAITAAATTKVTSTFLATVSATGTYIVHYFSDGTDVHCSTAGASARACLG